MVTIIKQVNTRWCFVDDAAPTVPLTDSDAVGDGGKVLYDLAQFLANNPLTGTVASVNTVVPVAGDVTIDMDDIAEAVALKLTAAERALIASTDTASSGNATAIARMILTQTIPIADPLVFDCDLGLNGDIVLPTGTGRVFPLLTNPVVGETAFFIVKQDATGSATLDTTAYHQPDGIALTLTTTASAVDLLSIFVESATVMHLSILHNSKLPP